MKYEAIRARLEGFEQRQAERLAKREAIKPRRRRNTKLWRAKQAELAMQRSLKMRKPVNAAVLMGGKMVVAARDTLPIAYRLQSPSLPASG